MSVFTVDNSEDLPLILPENWEIHEGNEIILKPSNMSGHIQWGEISEKIYERTSCKYSKPIHYPFMIWVPGDFKYKKFRCDRITFCERCEIDACNIEANQMGLHEDTLLKETHLKSKGLSIDGDLKSQNSTIEAAKIDITISSISEIEKNIRNNNLPKKPKRYPEIKADVITIRGSVLKESWVKLIRKSSGVSAGDPYSLYWTKFSVGDWDCYLMYGG